MTCSSHKRIYLTEGLAEDALIEAQTRSAFSKGSGPVAVYQCSDCGKYHLTSKGTINPRLAKLIESGRLKRDREADDWERKLRK